MAAESLILAREVFLLIAARHLPPTPTASPWGPLGWTPATSFQKEVTILSMNHMWAESLHRRVKSCQQATNQPASVMARVHKMALYRDTLHAAQVPLLTSISSRPSAPSLRVIPHGTVTCILPKSKYDHVLFLIYNMKYPGSLSTWVLPTSTCPHMLT